MTPEPFSVAVEQSMLDDLRERLAAVRWPRLVDGPGWEDGTSSAWLRELVAYWRDGFDWRAQEADINRFAHFRSKIDGVRVHFVHERGRGPAPLPLVLTHGWPSTFYELLPLVPLLTEPPDPADAFDVVIPSLPGYGFSDALEGRGSTSRIPALWVRLMRDALGYDRRHRRATSFRPDFGDAKAPGRLARKHARVIDLPHVFAVALLVLTIALFAAMIWAGHHEH